MKITSASQKYWLAFEELTQMNRDMNMRHETWTWDMNMRYETWTWDMDMGHETWIWDMNTKLKVRVTLHAPVLATFITCSLARSCTTRCQLLCLVQRQDELIKEDWLIKMSINGWLNRLALHRYLRLSTHYPWTGFNMLCYVKKKDFILKISVSPLATYFRFVARASD